MYPSVFQPFLYRYSLNFQYNLQHPIPFFPGSQSLRLIKFFAHHNPVSLPNAEYNLLTKLSIFDYIGHTSVDVTLSNQCPGVEKKVFKK